MTVDIEPPIPTYTLKAAGRALRFQFLWLLNSQMAKAGQAPEIVAARLGWSRRRFNRLLAGHGQITLREIADIFWAIDGSIIDFDLTAKGRTK